MKVFDIITTNVLVAVNGVVFGGKSSTTIFVLLLIDQEDGK